MPWPSSPRCRWPCTEVGGAVIHAKEKFEPPLYAINAAVPTWIRFNNCLPNTMIWDMQIDRGSTTLSLWTRGRGAYVWPLPSGPVANPVSLSAWRRVPDR